MVVSPQETVPRSRAYLQQKPRSRNSKQSTSILRVRKVLPEIFELLAESSLILADQSSLGRDVLFIGLAFLHGEACVEGCNEWDKSNPKQQPPHVLQLVHVVHNGAFESGKQNEEGDARAKHPQAKTREYQ